MKTETLRGLLVDRQFGELPPDTAELLDAYIAAVPAARAEADATTRTVSTTRDAVQRHPDLVPTAGTKVTPVFLWLMRAAAVIAVAVAGGWFGYRAVKTAPPAVGSRVQGVWAQYQVAYDSYRGAYVVAQEN